MPAAFTITRDARKFFFDREIVKRAVDPAKHRILFKAAMQVRKRAIYSIKNRLTGHSQPGQPPYSHVGARLRRANAARKRAGKTKLASGFKGIKQIEAAWIPDTETAIIGPYSRKSGHVPNALEFGGQTRTRQYRGGRLVRGVARIEPRPFMGPARDAVAPSLPAMWAGAVKG